MDGPHLSSNELACRQTCSIYKISVTGKVSVPPGLVKGVMHHPAMFLSLHADNFGAIHKRRWTTSDYNKNYFAKEIFYYIICGFDYPVSADVISHSRRRRRMKDNGNSRLTTFLPYDGR